MAEKILSPKIRTLLSAHPLFAGVPTDSGPLENETDAGRCYLITVAAGEQITAPGRWIGLIVSGRVRIYSTDSTRQVMLRAMTAGDMLGIAQFFSQVEAPISRAVAHSETQLLILTADAVQHLLDASPRFRDNCLAFLAGRIAFLNRKITTFTGGSAERRLAHYLDTVAADNDCFLCPVSLSAMADTLDISRASLYRAFQTLEQDGFLIRTGKRFCLRRRTELLTQYQ